MVNIIEMIQIINVSFLHISKLIVNQILISNLNLSVSGRGLEDLLLSPQEDLASQDITCTEWNQR